MKMRFVSLGFLVVIGVSSGSLRGDDNEGEKLVRAERLVEMTKRWQAYKASLIRDDKETELEPHPQPLLRWNDPARKDMPIEDGALWAWGTKGRPAALLTQESYGGKWVCELNGFLPITVARVEANLDGTNVWSRPLESQPQLQKAYTAYSSE